MTVLALRQPTERVRSTGRRPVRVLVSRMLVLVLLLVGAAAVASWYLRDFLAQHLYVATPAVAVMVFVALVLRRPGRSAAAPSVELEEVADLEDAPASPEAGEVEAPAHVEAQVEPPVEVEVDESAMDPRALQLYVRSLEAALSEQDERLDDVRRDAGRRAEDVVRRDRERLRATVHAMQEVLVGLPGDVAARRIAAATDRIGVEPTFSRPPLCDAPSGGLVVTFGAPPAAVAAHAPARHAAPAVDAEPLTPIEDTSPLPSGVVSEDAVEPVSEPAPPAPRRVLPVPAPPTPAAPERGRRRRRNTAAV